MLPYHLQDYIHKVPKLKPHLNSRNSSLNAFSTNHHYISLSFYPMIVTLGFKFYHASGTSSYEEATIIPASQAIMTLEFDVLYLNHTWDILPQKAIGCKCIIKIKHKVDESVERFKARLVIKGYAQWDGNDNTKTFSPVVKMTIVRALITTTVKNGWCIS